MEPVATGLTYDDLAALPDDGQRHELIRGEHFVTPAPILRHQDVVLSMGATALAWARVHGGRALVAPTSVVFGPDTVLQPDVLVLGSVRAGQLGDPRFVDVPPDLVIEVSSPSTRGYDLVRKRRVYEEHGVPEFWFVDLDAARVEQYVLGVDGYGTPQIAESGVLVSSSLDGLQVDVARLFD